MTTIRLYGFHNTPKPLLNQLAETLSRHYAQFFKGVEVHNNELDVPPTAFVPTRQQYRAAPFLNALAPHVPKKTSGLALVNYDLFVPQLNFIFGLAQRYGNALVALPRLDSAFYGFPHDFKLYYQRIIKEVIHELGHVLGLNHCANHCVMRFSNTLQDTDEKPEEYCYFCSEQLP